MKARQTLVIPLNVPHGAEALEDTDVLDTFSPIRTDWLNGQMPTCMLVGDSGVLSI